MHQLEQEKSSSHLALFIFGLAFLIPGIGMIFLLESEGFIAIPFVVCFGGVGLLMVVGSITGYLKSRRLSQPIIGISQPTVRVGETFDVAYQQSINTQMNVKMLRFQLVFRETARYQQGTDTYTETENYVIDEYRHPAGSYNAGHVFSDNWQIQIPVGKMHTFKSTNNQLEWFIAVRLEEKHNHDYEFEIPVLPDIVITQQDSFS